MANYSITINSKFKPFSFERYIQPYVMYGNYFSNLEDAITAYETEADKIKTLANQTSDPIAYATYKNYSDYLTEQMNNLYENGATPINRKGLVNAKRRYNSEIAPIISAANYRKEVRLKQDELRAKDPYIRFDNDFGTISLDDLVKNPNMGYRSISGTDVANMASSYAANVAKGLMEDPEYSKILNGAFFREKLQQGFSVDQVFAEALAQTGKKFTKKDIENINKLKSMREAVHSMNANNPAYDKNWANPYISFGFTGGIGAIAFSKFENPDYLDAGERFSQAMQSAHLELAKRADNRAQQNFEKGNTPLDIGDGYYMDPTNRYKVFRYKADGKSKIYYPNYGESSSSSTTREGMWDVPIKVPHMRNQDDINSGNADWKTVVYKKGSGENEDNFNLEGNTITYDKLGPATKKRLKANGITENNYQNYTFLDQVDKNDKHNSDIIAIPQVFKITGNSTTNNYLIPATNYYDTPTVPAVVDYEYGNNIEGYGSDSY